ncbi:hypothetical protein BD324DRAFT_652735 [Kockovaella imperatae]|uniref:Uncharacterized protein n=1 Tax=Kockovaella imperatae TaxID=4999 RepID=A0A1Y1UD70_9TREE|nr:hypothetical protein BD324DRAFT_652735 [Kockovaella imperatae]ORX35015.1 hypothetical protein BD324DRAFT_652735 [Kockovaella imperatae]
MSTHTVGVLAPNGRVGSAVVSALLKYHNEGKIALVLLHRPGSPPKAQVPDSVNVREIELEKEVDDIAPAIKGLNVIVSALGPMQVPLQVPLVNALAKSPDFVTLIPAYYGHSWIPEDLADNPIQAKIFETRIAPKTRATELGISTTMVNTGIFDQMFFALGFVGTNVNTNTVQANEAQLKHKIPITTIPYLAEGIAQIVLQSPESLKDKAFTLVDHWPLGDEVIDALTQVNGSKPTVKDYTDADASALKSNPPIGPGSAAYRRAWTNDKWNYEPEFNVKGFEKVSLADVAKSWKQ